MPRIYQKKLNSEQAKQSTKILESTELAKLMSDINTQPDWRTLARRAMSYYDGLPHARGGVSEKVLIQVGVPASSPRPWGCFP